MLSNWTSFLTKLKVCFKEKYKPFVSHEIKIFFLLMIIGVNRIIYRKGTNIFFLSFFSLCFALSEQNFVFCILHIWKKKNMFVSQKKTIIFIIFGIVYISFWKGYTICKLCLLNNKYINIRAFSISNKGSFSLMINGNYISGSI